MATFIIFKDICLDVEVFAHDTIRALVALQLEALMVLNQPHCSIATNSTIVLLFSCWPLGDSRRCLHLGEICGHFAHHLDLWLCGSITVLLVMGG